ncbi:ABC transporter substrate-binding protein [Flexibacterium corallicola]|uniref:ABC transporter substrate-binding protein n=1 Tax=Flexibacterium corallicola TaxID=3037259 RepID=UPI00286F4FF9|nr:ABC transporter substrate-binding protein [Pseudovibrio sp. M1P-2-3]
MRPILGLSWAILLRAYSIEVALLNYLFGVAADGAGINLEPLSVTWNEFSVLEGNVKKIGFACASLAALLMGSMGAASASTDSCEIDRPVVFAGLDWDSAAFHNSVAQYILEEGYGCETDIIPGSLIPLINGMARGNVDVTMEIVPSSSPEALIKGLNENAFVDLGVNYPDSMQGWFIPKYLVEGDDAPAKGLKGVEDLAQYKELFADPEEPGMGRFYNCTPGWACEVTNTKRLVGYKLADDFTNFRPGSGAALSAAIESSLKRRKPVLFYYWGPTWLLGKYQNDLYQLREPEFDQATWDAILAESDPEKVTKATPYPLASVHVFANTKFSSEAPEISKFLTNYNTTSSVVSDALAYMRETGGTPDDAAVSFLKENEALWTSWVPESVGVQVKQSLSAQ